MLALSGIGSRFNSQYRFKIFSSNINENYNKTMQSYHIQHKMVVFTTDFKFIFVNFK